MKQRYASMNHNSNNTNHRHRYRSGSTANTINGVCRSTVTIEIQWLILCVMALSVLLTFITILNLNGIGIISGQNYSTIFTSKHISWEMTSEQIEHQQPFNEHSLATKATNLIIVAGHSVAVSGHLLDANHDEADWYMLEYQKHHGLPEAIIKHIETGIRYAAHDSQSLLIFSGGQTRAMIGPESEGSSYYRVADVMNLWSQQELPTARRLSKQYVRGGSGANTAGTDHHINNDNIKSNDTDDPTRTVRARTITEEYATDSFQNLLYSICRFYEITGRYPHEITMISYTFKEHRFVSLHVPALRWPINTFHYIGVDPPIESGFDLQESTKGEIENAAKPFDTDPYGCHSTILKEKRVQRNPFIRTPPYDVTCPGMVELLHYCGQTFIDEDQVPWSQH